jgi:hypothetical protein
MVAVAVCDFRITGIMSKINMNVIFRITSYPGGVCSFFWFVFSDKDEKDKNRRGEKVPLFGKVSVSER